jgi:hypothetical protein
MKNIFWWILIIGFLIVLGFFWVNQQNIFKINSSVESLNPIGSPKSPDRVSTFNGIDVNKVQYIKIAGVVLKVDLALTSLTQEQGLSGRVGLKKDEGMLFVFDHVDKYPFWMKDMNFPIDIIWIGEDLKVVYIKKNASPKSYPETFVSGEDAKYVLEVMSSFSEKNNLKVGDKVEFLSS